MANVINANLVRDTSNPPDAWCVTWRLLLSLIQAGWQIKSSSNGTTKLGVGTASPTNFSLATLQNIGGGGTGPSVVNKEFSGLMTITGLSGLVSPTATDPGSEGNFITFAGFASGGNDGTFQIAEVLSATSCTIWNTSGVSGDANNGNVGVTWQEKSFKTATYSPPGAVVQWAVLEGPRVIKVPVNTTPSSSFLIGETVYQGATVATQRSGTLAGVVMNSGGTSGWMAIEPHDYGTWDTVDDIVGVTSGATLAAANISATPVVYANEVMFAKSPSNYYQGSFFWWCGDRSGENSDSLSGRAGSTAAIPPGFTTDTFPTNAALGYGGNAAHQNVINTTAANMGAKAQVMCANALPRPRLANSNARTPRYADGSFTVLYHTSAALLTDGSYPVSWQRCDDVEPGDLSPFAVLTQAQGTTNFDKKANLANNYITATSGIVNLGTTGSVNAWVAFPGRGCGVAARDIVQPYVGLVAQTTSVHFMSLNSGEAWRLAVHPDTTPPIRPERIGLYNDGSANLTGGVTSQIKTKKGSPRWVRLLPTGSRMSTADNKLWISIAALDSTYGCLMFGPYNGSTTPVAT